MFVDNEQNRGNCLFLMLREKKIARGEEGGREALKMKSEREERLEKKRWKSNKCSGVSVLKKKRRKCQLIVFAVTPPWRDAFGDF